MIDWWNIFSQALWIVGLALLLATFSYNSYRASQAPQETKQLQLVQPAFFGRLGLMLVSAGLAATSGTRIERVLWGVLLCGTLIEGARWIWYQGLHMRRSDLTGSYPVSRDDNAR